MALTQPGTAYTFSSITGDPMGVNANAKLPAPIAPSQAVGSGLLSNSYQKQGFNVQRFMAFTDKKDHFVKPSKFLARIPLPRGFIGDTELTNVNRNLEFWCDTASLPGAALLTRDVARYGYGAKEKRPVANIFQDLSFTFYASAGNGTTPNTDTSWNFFTTWVRMITNFNMNEGLMMTNNNNGIGGGTGTLAMQPYEVAYKYQYVSDIHLVVFRDDGSESHHVVLRDAFPTYVQEVRTSWGDTQNIMIIPVLFSFTDWFIDNNPLASG